MTSTRLALVERTLAAHAADVAINLAKALVRSVAKVVLPHAPRPVLMVRAKSSIPEKTCGAFARASIVG